MDPIKNIPDTRGICSATEGPISRLEYLSSMWIDPVVNNQRSITECKSTNDMKLNMDEVNKIPIAANRRRIVLSLDIEKMYPSLDKELIKDLTYKLIRDNGNIITGIEWKEIMIFLHDNYNSQLLKEYGLSRLVPQGKLLDKKGKHLKPEDFYWYQIDHNTEIVPNQKQVNKVQGCP